MGYVVLESRPHRRKIPDCVRASVYRRAKHRCQYCGLKFTPTDKSLSGRNAPRHRTRRIWLEIDHVVPYSLGGTDDVANLRAACSTCNQSRGVDTADAWGEKVIHNGA